jgi:2-dehydropantoate 2-reductase
VVTTAVLGPGGVGGFLAAALERAGEPVVVVAHEETVTHLAGSGIAVQSARLGDFTVHPRVVSRLDEAVHTLIVATKANGLGQALERIGPRPALVVPLLNGLDHMDVLRGHFGPEVVAAGTIRIESDRPQTGHILQTSPFLRVDLAAENPVARAELPPVQQTLEGAEVPTRIEASEKQILWSKLVRLNALACTTSAADRPVGFIRSDPEWRRALVGCTEEGAAVARADGADIDPAARLAELDDAHPELGSSMQRDIAAGREPELDAIPGAVLRAGARLGIECPTIARLADQIAARAGVAPVRR